jgi:dihydrofolate synthase/folylpolyglutamate synthase
MGLMSIAKMKTAYDAALDYLYSFVDYSLTRQLRYSPEKFNLDRMRRLAERLGNPQSHYPVIHVAGTKGKGSTSVFVASALQQAGYRVGLYTSPHLHDYVERIQVNRSPMLHEELVESVEQLKPGLQEIPEITTFEITTAIAFKYFAEKKVDIAVVEVGLGGRLDATNIVDPLMSVITSLSYDHMNILGDTIEKIAAEKGGIIKQGRAVVVAPQGYPQVYGVLEEIAKARQAPLYRVDHLLTFSVIEHDLEKQVFELQRKTAPEEGLRFRIPLVGFHQVENAVTAYCVLKELANKGFNLEDSIIQKGFQNASWPCRFEVVQHSPLVIVDSAHNADSAEKLSLTVREYLKDKKVVLVFGVSEDKDVKGMFASLLPISDVMIMTKSIHPRALEPAQLGDIAREMGYQSIVTDSLETALDVAFAQEKADAILVTGSIFVAAAAKEIILMKNQDK